MQIIVVKDRVLANPRATARVSGSRMVLLPSRPLRTARMSFPICSLKPFLRPLQDAVSLRFFLGYGFADDMWDEAERGSLLCLVHLWIASGCDGFASQ